MEHYEKRRRWIPGFMMNELDEQWPDGNGQEPPGRYGLRALLTAIR